MKTRNTPPARRDAVPLVVILLSCALLLPAAAMADDQPGYVDLSWIEIPADAAEIQDIDLTVMLAELAADARADGEDELAELLGTITSLRVKAYSIAGDHEKSREAVERVTRQLAKDGWNRIVYLKDGDETMSVSTYRHDGHMVGLTVVAYEPGGQVGFVNVVGNLDLGHLLSLARETDLEELGERLAEKSDVRVE